VFGICVVYLNTDSAYRASRIPSHPPPFDHNPREIYHSLWPLPALSPVPDDGGIASLKQAENESAYRQLLVQAVLAVLLPTEDLQNDCLTTLVGQIFSEMIIGGGIGGKACEPWLLWDGITKIVEVIQDQLPNSKAQVRLERSNSDLTDSVPLVFTGASAKGFRIGRSLQKTFWLILQYGFLAFTAIRFFIITLATASSLPSRVLPTTKSTGLAYTNNHMEALELTDVETTSQNRQTCPKQPILKMKIWSCASCLLDLNMRMPWLSATISLLQWGATAGPGEIGNTDGMVDK
jgi:hypothetical protein